MVDTQDAANRVRSALNWALRLRAEASSDGVCWNRRQRLRVWQSQRLAVDHQNLRQSPRYGDATSFFLDELYGPKDVRQRDADVERVLPAMVRLLPDRALHVLAEALELDALSESLDLDMVATLGDQLDGETDIDGPAWSGAYRTIGRPSDRGRQIELVAAIGSTLDQLSRHPALGKALAVMRVPARLAGFATLQAFLERGFRTFAAMGGAQDFMDEILHTERNLMMQLLAGGDWPFVADASPSTSD